MGSLDRRIEDLERRFASDSSKNPSGARLQMVAILDEFAALKQSYAHGLRGGVPIVPERIPLKILGPGYTYREFVRLTLKRASEAGAFPEEEIPRWTAAAFWLFGRRMDLDTVVEWEQEAHGV